MHHSKWLIRASVCLVFAALAASQVAAAGHSPVRSLLEIRRQNVVIQEWDTSCGAAALATILTYQLDDPVSEKQVAQGMLRRTDPLRVRHRGGFSLLDMKRYAQSRGFAADGYVGLTLERLRRLAPLIVPVRFEGYDHFIIFRGAVADAAVLADPAFGNRKMPLGEFEKMWSGKVGFVVKPGDTSAPVNRMSPRDADFVAVKGESMRAALDSSLPAALSDLQMVNMSAPEITRTAAAPAPPAPRSSAPAAAAIAPVRPVSVSSPTTGVPVPVANAVAPTSGMPSPGAITSPGPAPVAPTVSSATGAPPPSVPLSTALSALTAALAPLNTPPLPPLRGR